MLVFIWGQGSQFDERTAKSEIYFKNIRTSKAITYQRHPISKVWKTKSQTFYVKNCAA